MVYKVQDTSKVKDLFEGWEETIIYSALDNIMGEIYTDTSPDTKADSAMLQLGEFILFAGKPSEELVGYRPEGYKSNFAIFIAKHDENEQLWHSVIEKVYDSRAKRITRYATKKEPHVFDTELLCKTANSLPEGYSFALMDEALYNECRKLEWGKDFVSQYPSWEKYKENAVGVMCINNGEIVAGMSTFSHFKGGIELELATREDHRRKGLAKAVSAKILLECQKRGLYPSWDAANIASITMAKFFGYQFDCEYPAYEISNY